MKICQQYFLDFVDLNKSLDENNENTSDNYKGFMTFMGLLYSRGVINIKVVIDCLDSIKRSIFCTECKCETHTGLNSLNKGKHTCLIYSEKLSGYKRSIDNKICNTICYSDCNECDLPSEENPLTTYRKHIECINLHKGYEHLLVHVTHSLDLRINELISNYNEKKNLTDEQSKSIVTAMEKLHEYLDVIISSHQEIVHLNKCYKSINKNQMVTPLRPHVMITHNSLGNSLAKLKEKISKFFSK
jgi:hypothetical protein